MDATWKIYPHFRGFVVLRGNKGEALTNDGSNEIAFDAGRLDCFFVTREAAQAAIAAYQGNEMFKVTYLNLLTGNREVLIDAIDKATAERVVAKFGNVEDEFNYLNETRIEPMAPAAPAV